MSKISYSSEEEFLKKELGILGGIRKKDLADLSVDRMLDILHKYKEHTEANRSYKECRTKCRIREMYNIKMLNRG